MGSLDRFREADVSYPEGRSSSKCRAEKLALAAFIGKVQFINKNALQGSHFSGILFIIKRRLMILLYFYSVLMI